LRTVNPNCELNQIVLPKIKNIQQACVS